MKNESITRVTWDELDQIEDLTDWERLNSMTEEEVEQNALDDPDNPPLTDEELEHLKLLPCPPFKREQPLGYSKQQHNKELNSNHRLSND